MTMEAIGANIFVETVYPGVNVGCIIAPDGAICVDTPMLPGEAQRWMARIRSLGAELVRFVVYTSGQSERVLGTQYLICGRPFPVTQQAAPTLQQNPRPRRIPVPRFAAPVTPRQRKGIWRGTVVAHKMVWAQVNDHRTDSFKQSMVDVFADRDPDMANLEVILPQITFDECVKLFAGDVTVKLLAAARGISWVWLPQQRVLFVGDALVVGTHPLLNVIDMQEWLASLEQLRREPQFQDAVIVPGRGPLCDTSASESLTEYLRFACDRTKETYRAGRPKADLNEVAAQLLPLYPVVDGQRERVQRQIKLGLDDLYDGLKVANADLE